MGYVIGIAYDAPRTELWSLIRKHGLESAVSGREREALTGGEISKQFKIDCKWLCESAQALMWCLGRAEMAPAKHCDDDLSERIPFKTDPAEFIGSAITRPVEDIARCADLYYRLHWYTKHCMLKIRECNLSNGIIMERRKALDWAYGTENNWDEVPLDT